mmetsp:Transcript_15104/g.32404  ORF Transcript_15104/g.32404 Transcript_15104/m.32404 type:complete len:810 (+) Transcript_15104:428-2857(+)
MPSRNGNGNGNGNINSIPWWQSNGNDEDLKRSDYDEQEQDDDIISTASSLYIEDNNDNDNNNDNNNDNDNEHDDIDSERVTRSTLASTENGYQQRRSSLPDHCNADGSKKHSSATATGTSTAIHKSNAVLRRKSSTKVVAATAAKRDKRVSLSDFTKPSGRTESFSRRKEEASTTVPRASKTRPSSSSTPPNSLERNQSSNKNNTNRSSKINTNNHKTRKIIEWTCNSCTFFNSLERRVSITKSTILTCEMCSAPYVIPATSTSMSTSMSTSTSMHTDNNNNTQVKNDELKPKQHTRRNSPLSQANNGNDDTDIGTNKSRKDNQSRHSYGEYSATTTSTGSSNSNGNGNSNSNGNIMSTNNRTSFSELVQSLGAAEGGSALSNLPPSLERRIQDFRFAQQKRREKHGDLRPWGIYGLYAHLSDIRADLEWAEDAAWRRRKNKPYLSWKDFDSAHDKGLHSRPYFTYGVMVLSTIMMFVILGVNGWKFEPLTINPLIGPSSETLIACGARDTNLIVNEGQWFRLFTPMVLHAGLVHYFVNMLTMYFIGGAVEKAHGAAFTSVLFIVPAVGGNIVSAICLPGFISVGASGGIFGLIGGCMADICLNWNLLFLKTTTDGDSRTRHLCVLLWLAMDIIINCLLGFTPFVDNFTHLGGFVYGFCIGFASIERLASGFFGIRIGDSFWSKLKSALLRYFGLVLSVVAIFATTIVLAQSDGLTSPCPGCRYISCVPFPPKAEEKWWYCDDCDIVTADLFMATDGSGLYQQVNIHCPNGETEEIPIEAEGIYDKEELRRLLPSFCRDYCAEVFANSN